MSDKGTYKDTLKIGERMRQYEQEKQKLREQPLTPAQYECRLRKLLQKLNL